MLTVTTVVIQGYDERHPGAVKTSPKVAEVVAKVRASKKAAKQDCVELTLSKGAHLHLEFKNEEQKQ